MTATFPRAWLCAVLGCLVSCARPLSIESRSESLVFHGVDFAGTARVETGPGSAPQLVILARLRNLTDSAAVVESAQSNCEPAFELVHVATGRRFVWNHVAWRQRHDILSPPPLNSVVCVGTGVRVTLGAHGVGEIARQAYPISMVRGDSMPAGTYRISIPVFVYTVVEGFTHVDSLRVWAPPIALPAPAS